MIKKFYYEETPEYNSIIGEGELERDGRRLYLVIDISYCWTFLVCDRSYIEMNASEFGRFGSEHFINRHLVESGKYGLNELECSKYKDEFLELISFVRTMMPELEPNAENPDD